MGGGEIIGSFLDEQAIDELVISVVTATCPWTCTPSNGSKMVWFSCTTDKAMMAPDVSLRETFACDWGLVRESLTRPYRVTVSMVVLVALVPLYVFIPAFLPGRAVHVPELALDRARAAGADLGARLWLALCVPHRAAGVRRPAGGADPPHRPGVPHGLDRGVRLLPRVSDRGPATGRSDRSGLRRLGSAIPLLGRPAVQLLSFHPRRAFVRLGAHLPPRASRARHRRHNLCVARRRVDSVPSSTTSPT